MDNPETEKAFGIDKERRQTKKNTIQKTKKMIKQTPPNTGDKPR